MANKKTIKEKLTSWSDVSSHISQTYGLDVSLSTLLRWHKEVSLNSDKFSKKKFVTTAEEVKVWLQKLQSKKT